MFTAVAYAQTGTETWSMNVRARLDRTNGTPREVAFAGELHAASTWPRAHAMAFVFENVAPGDHRIEVQWSESAGHQIFLHDRTTVVQHQ
jgi:hypothetical protein